MPEGKQEKKKTWIVKRILKWIGLGLLSLLLIAAIIFQAPWKVITLFAVILLACTAMPKPHRKFFWASVGVVVIALIIWVFLPDRNGDWRPYTFDDELAALETARAIPDEQNAAVIYEELFANYDGYIFVPPKLKIEEAKDVNIVEYMNLAEEARPEDTFYPEFWNDELDDLTLSKAWSSKGHPKVAEWLQDKHGCTIADLLRACRKDACRFPIRIDPGRPEQMNRNSAMRRWAKLLIRAGNKELGEGCIDEAFEKYLCVLQMAKHQCQQPTHIDLLTGISLEALAMRQFNRFIVTADATEERLSTINKALSEIKHDWSFILPMILETEKLLMKNTCAILYEVNPKGKTRFTRNPTTAIRAQFAEEVPSPTYWQRKLMKAHTILLWFYMPSTPQKLSKITDASYERFYAMAKPDFDWQKESKGFSLISAKFNFRFMTEMLVSIIEPAYHGIHDLYLRLMADKRGSQIIIALRRYKNTTGHWPKNLEDIKNITAAANLIDPINNSSFVYRLTDDNFTLYSKGKNNIDEDGKYKRRYGETSKGDDWLIWPPKSSKTKEENADVKQ